MCAAPESSTNVIQPQGGTLCNTAMLPEASTSRKAHQSGTQYLTLHSKTVHLSTCSTAQLIGCGIDGETIQRFSHLANHDNPYPMVFSADEVGHLQTLAEQATGFCASFCCKEALHKALGHPYNFTECELFYDPDRVLQYPRLSIVETTTETISDCTVQFLRPTQQELVAIVHLFSRRPE